MTGLEVGRGWPLGTGVCRSRADQQYVTQRRLSQCRAALASPTGADRSVADIAFGWGFNSLATFYRAFEREFGLSPTALRAVRAAGLGDCPKTGASPFCMQ